MSHARTVRFTAEPGRAEELERLLVQVALAAAPSGDGPSPADIMPLLDGPPDRTDLEPLGGLGL